jgi:uncharacterized GH25 family protein
LPQGPSCLIARDWPRNLAATGNLDTATTNLDLQLQPGFSLGGQVTDEAGKPITNAPLNLTLHLGSRQSTTTSTSFDKEPYRTDAQGRFEFGVLPRGLAYSLSVYAKGYGSDSRLLEAEQTKTNHVEWVLLLKTANLKLAGQVVDAQGKPLAGACLSVSGEGQPYSSSVQTDANGQFEFNQLCAGPVQVGALYQGAFGQTRAKAGDTNVLVRIAVKNE